MVEQEVRKIIRFKVGVVSTNTGFCYFYRLKWPLQVLEKYGYVQWQLVNPNKGREGVIALVDWADIIIFQYGVPSEFIKALAITIKEEKVAKIIISEFDDDYTSIHPSNFAYAYFGTKEIKLSTGKYLWKEDEEIYDEHGKLKCKFNIAENKKRIQDMFEAIVASDAITVTGPNLASVFYEFNKNVVVLPNYLNPNMMMHCKRIYPEDKDVITIGWQGGDSHYDDLRSVIPFLAKIKRKYGKRVQFVFMGAAFQVMFSEVDGHWIPWVRPDKFFAKYSLYLPDIALIPLLNTKFNRCKSNIKWLEASYYKVPSVVANVTPYKEDIQHMRTAMLYDTGDQLVKHLSALIEDPVLRLTIGGQAHAWVTENRNIQKEAYRWYNLFQDLFDRKLEYLSGL